MAVNPLQTSDDALQRVMRQSPLGGGNKTSVGVFDDGSGDAND